MSDLTKCWLIGALAGLVLAAGLWFGFGWFVAAYLTLWGCIGVATIAAFVRQNRRLNR